MKNTFAGVSILVLAAAAAAFAQTTHSVTAQVPFEFTVSGASLPADHYVIDTGAQGILTLHAVDSRKNAIVRAVGARTLDPQKGARLVFHRYGNQYFLHQVWGTGSDAGREVPVSKQERALAKGPSNSKRVVILASN